MCGRITATFEFNDIKIRWNLEHDLAAFAPHFNIAPEQTTAANEQKVPVILRHENTNQCRLMKWGLIPNWATDPTMGNQMINARAESLTEEAAFKDLVEKRRCIVPADGFYEWRKEGKRKIPMWVHLKSREPFYGWTLGRMAESERETS
jgi:putative SOS response-associated peptidase YedK